MNSAESTQRYLEDLELSTRPTAAEEYAARGISSELSHLLQNHVGIEQVEMVGSINRGTHLSPIDDIDMVCVFGGESDIPGHRHLQDLIIHELRGSGLLTEVHRGDAVVCGVWNDRVHEIDLIPLVRVEDGALVLRRPASTGDRLISHDPWRQSRLTDEKDRETDRMYRPAVRLLKLWNRNNRGPIPRSYLAEVFAWYGLDEASSYAQAMSEALDYAHQALQAEFLADPGNPDDNVLGGLSDEVRRASRARIDEARRSVAQLAESQDNGEGEWRRLFRLS